MIDAPEVRNQSLRFGILQFFHPVDDHLLMEGRNIELHWRRPSTQPGAFAPEFYFWFRLYDWDNKALLAQLEQFEQARERAIAALFGQRIERLEQTGRPDTSHYHWRMMGWCGRLKVEYHGCRTNGVVQPEPLDLAALSVSAPLVYTVPIHADRWLIDN